MSASVPSAIAFALDYASLDEARAAATRVGPAVGMVKVGLELFVGFGPQTVAIGRDIGKPVFLDLKLHDIPETVERAVLRAKDAGARMVTVHASGGRTMMERAVQAAGAALEIVAVTVLTSLDESDLRTQGVPDAPAEHALRLARLAHDAGVRAFVCSPNEVALLRRELGAGVTLVVPGIRSGDGPKDDQKRTATAARAIADGATWLVVGRPIRDAKDPFAAATALARECEGART